MPVDPTVQVAIIGGVFLIISAWITRPSRRTHRAVTDIQQEFRNNGGSSTKDALDRIEHGLFHLNGRFDQHLEDSRDEKQAAREEATQMWAAIEAAAKAKPPEGA